jgi:hypothetical protein
MPSSEGVEDPMVLTAGKLRSLGILTDVSLWAFLMARVVLWEIQ